jgi:hypothetical protein
MTECILTPKALANQRVYHLVKDRSRLMGDNDASRHNVAVICWKLGEMRLQLDRDMVATLGYNLTVLDIYRDTFQRPSQEEGAMEPWRVGFSLAEARAWVGATLVRRGDPSGALLCAVFVARTGLRGSRSMD